MKNKVMMFLASLLIWAYAPKAQNKQGYILNCQFKGLSDKTKVYLITQEKDTIQAVLSNGNQFVFEGRQEPEGRFHFIRFDTLMSPVISKAIFITNKQIRVEGIIGESVVNVIGSSEQDEYKALSIFSSELGKAAAPQIDDNFTKFKLKSNNINNDPKLSEIERKLELEKITQEFKRIDDLLRLDASTHIKNWLIEHKLSLIAPYGMLASLGNITNEHRIEILKAFPQATKDSYYGRQVKEAMDMTAEPADIKQGVVFPGLSVYNMDGIAEKILDVIKKNRLTLIDCWASWCKPCRAEVPELKKIYAKYKDKGVNIVGVSSDKDALAWKKAIKDDQTTWPHFIEDKTKLLSKAFKLQAIPAYILVNSEGKIIAFDCAMSNIPNFGGGLRGEALEKKLEELLGSSK